MTSHLQERKRGHKAWYARWTVWIGMVGALALTVVSITIVREIVAYRAFSESLAIAREQGIAVDIATIAKRFERDTTRENSIEWREVLGIASNARVTRYVTYLSNIRARKENDAIPPLKPDEYFSLVQGFLDEHQPLLNKVKRLQSSGKPVWYPIEFKGYNTLLVELQSTRQVMDLLQLEFELAQYAHDRDRSIQALHAMENLIEAFDTDFCSIAVLIGLSLREDYYQSIRKSLEHSIWNDDDLQHLTDVVRRPLEIERIWTNMMDGECAFFFNTDLENIGGSSPIERIGYRMLGSIVALPSTRKYVWDVMRRRRDVGSGGIDGLLSRAERIDSKLSQEDTGRIGSYLLSQMFSIGPQARAVERFEMLRRLTLVSLVTHRFERSEHRWPTELSELKNMGLVDSDSHESIDSTFGYRISEGDNAAWIWGYSLREQRHADFGWLVEELPKWPKFDYVTIIHPSQP